jgi:hypothetical protein
MKSFDLQFENNRFRPLSIEKIMFKRAFTNSAITRGLYKDFVQSLKVKEITASELKAKLTSDPVHGFAKNIHVLDVR